MSGFHGSFNWLIHCFFFILNKSQNRRDVCRFFLILIFINTFHIQVAMHLFLQAKPHFRDNKRHFVFQVKQIKPNYRI